MEGLKSFFNPKSIAVIGASRTPGKIGHAIVTNIMDSGFKGNIYPINPKETEIEGLKCFPTVKQVAPAPEMAIVSVPAKFSLQVAEECGEAGVKYLVVITAGFKEIGSEGLQREKKLVEICRRYGMRMLGPNCVGVIDTHTPVNASFAKGFPLKGKIAFISQSGAMLIAILDWSLTNGIGFSSFISLGNKGDLNESDFIVAAADDPNTKVVLCYIEDVANGEEFLEAARNASQKKPIVILKSGTSQAGAQAASSHTGALAGSDTAYDIAFRQSGVLRAKDMQELFDLAICFANMPLPKGERVALVTNSGGPAILATDEIERSGMQMARFSKQTIEKLRQGLPAEANIYNPVDVLGDANAERYRLALEQVLKDENSDAVILLLSPTATTEPEATANLALEMHEKFPDKPLLAVYMGGKALRQGQKTLQDKGIPTFIFPEPAVKALAGMHIYAQRKKQIHDNGELNQIKVDKKAVKAVLYDVLKDHRLVLLGSEAAQLASAYGIPAAPTLLATTPDQARKYADELGYPVVMKVSSPKIVHKSDVGGVRVGLESAEAVTQAYREILDNVKGLFPDTVLHGIEIQKMMPKGIELIIGMTRDMQFGPQVAFGLGGIYVNLLKDVSFRLVSGLTRKEIRAMISDTKAATLLRGYRGEKPADIEAVIDAIAQVARLVQDFPEIMEMDINPFIAYPEGASALDVKITINSELLRNNSSQ